MNLLKSFRTAAALWTLAAALPAMAWGPQTQVAIVSTAVQLVSQDRTMPLRNLRDYVRQGAALSAEEIQALYPAFSTDPVNTIKSEMFLLQAVKSDRIDPYFAYRLGILGKLVARATAPLGDAPEDIQNAYYSDVDEVINQVALNAGPRRTVDANIYLEEVRAEARGQDQTISSDYQTGQGFGGTARAALAIDASRSVNAVADILYTTMLENASLASVSANPKRDYFQRGIAFYLERGNLTEAHNLYERVESLGLMTPDYRKTLGDLYYDSENFERAVEIYETVLVEDPGRRDVAERIAAYFKRMGEEAQQAGRLEAAEEAFNRAGVADMLDAEARRRVLNVQDEIAARDARRDAASNALERGQALLVSAQEAALDGNYANAITYLREARARFDEVPTEFDPLWQQADQNKKIVDAQMRDYTALFIDSAQGLSGTGFELSAPLLAETTPDVDREALRSLLQSLYNGAVEQLGQQLTQTNP